MRGRKQGFSIPAAAWLRGELEPFAREMLSPERAARARASSSPTAVTALIDAHVARREDLSRQLWGLLVFSLWHERYGVGRRQPRATRRRTLRRSSMPNLLDAFLAFVLALVVVWISTPVVKALAWRIGAIDEPRARGLHQFPTPRLGGLAILAGDRWRPGSCSCRRASRRPASWSARR